MDDQVRSIPVSLHLTLTEIKYAPHTRPSHFYDSTYSRPYIDCSALGLIYINEISRLPLLTMYQRNNKNAPNDAIQQT
jgi:hypothetical protein